MLFNSYEFIFLFLPIVLITYFQLAKWKGRETAIGWLTLSSLAFYGYWDIRYVPLLLGSIVFNYAVGTHIEKAYQKKKILVLGIVGNLLLLGYFKYTGFFISTLNTLSGSSVTIPQIILPLGISFFTFTQTAYLVDAYRGETKKYSFGTYCLFVTIFPHLIAGPIINHKTMIPQFNRMENFRVDYNNFARGIMFFLIGLFKKVALADTLAPWVAMAFNHTDKLGFVEAWIGAVAYTFQLYFDFSGYSEMAIGLGLMLNFQFPVNFNSPYKARSMIDFWRRWHMTLSVWVKDYLYIPLGGNRHGEWKKMRNLFVSMLLIGLWHGAGWTFVVWGGLHGLFLMINHQWRRVGVALPMPVNWILTFVSVVVAWVFFRADSITAALQMLSAMVDVQHITFSNLEFVRGGVEYRWLAVAAVVLMFCKNTQERMEGFAANRKWLLAGIVLAVISLLHFSHVSDFLYFQF